MKRPLFALMRSFIVYKLVTACTVARFASANTRTKRGKPQIRYRADANDDSRINTHSEQNNDRPPTYWPRYSGSRRVRLLDGTWKASFLDSPHAFRAKVATDGGRSLPSFDSMDPNIDISKIHTIEKVAIPSTVEVLVDPEHGYLPGYMGYRGVSFYRTSFETETKEVAIRSTPGSMEGRSSGGPAARIQFQACSFYCRVWLNGVEIGNHTAGGYVAWWLDVSDEVLQLGSKVQKSHEQLPRIEGEEESAQANIVATVVRTQELFVLVDNQFNSTTAPLHTGGDFWDYGGIMRSVEWHDRPNPSLPAVTVVEASRDIKDVKDDEKLDQELLLQEKENGVALLVNGSHRNVATTTRVVQRAMTGDQHPPVSSLSDVWPWRLYVIPQKDLRSVELSLEVVGGSDGRKRSTKADFLEELRKNTQIKIYFDGNATTNAMDEDFRRKERRVDPNMASGPTDIRTATEGGNDRMLGLGLFSVPNPRIWSTTDPQLHTVSVDLNGAIVTERFGLRYWDVGTPTGNLVRDKTRKNRSDTFETSNTSNGRIRLNGEILKLVGWNHHTQWPHTAGSPTDEQLDEDIRLLKESGHANFVRGAHYPQDSRWLDRLDEHGIVVWSETLGPRVSVANLQDDYFLKAQNQQVNEMLTKDFNHASIAFWGFFNEGPSNHEEACEGYRASSDAILARDTSRFVTYASDQPPPRDKCFEAATVLSFNGYPGWYGSYGKGGPEEYWSGIATELRSGKYPSALGKPLLISETGAGGIYEWKHNRTKVFWTLGYQSDIISQDVATAINNANFSGIALWHFFDFKVDDKWENNTHCDYLPGILPLTCGYINVSVGNPGGRPGGANHKGCLDFFRRPKPVFDVVASQYKKSVTEAYAASRPGNTIMYNNQQ